MTTKLNLSDALSYGLDRITTRGGAILVVVYALFQLAMQVSVQSLFSRVLADVFPDEKSSQLYPLAVDLPIAVSAGVTALLVLVGAVIGVVTIRALYAGINDVPTADHTRRLARTAGVTVIVSVVTFVAVLVGTAFLIFPGIFLAVSLVFATVVVIIEDAGVIESLERSWELSSGHRFRLLVLGVIIGAGGGLVRLAFGIVGVFAPVVGELATTVTSGVLSLFGAAVLVGAYRQLAGDREPRSPSEW
ncbi:hypothetical protein [Natrinema pallidum]|uniref:DUF7847 domain-containing protein n=1 Tax=Natrinema pallidum DSM 3751 TaxID=1227495 RepID=L9YRA6_9EURY|nr:hypothetical protein [Natrinema pallidum]ELY76216.1 hypothetical protein C487_12156 [Natrinema pallidum DSM 3751]